MQRYFISDNNFNENIIAGDDVFHLVRVMRIKLGDRVEICHNGRVYLVKITEIDKTFVRFAIISEIKTDFKKWDLTLIQGMPKGDKIDEIIMHSTELLISNVVVVNMQRSIAKIEPVKAGGKLLRYQKIAKEAAEQAHLISIPTISYAKSIKEIDYSLYKTKILLDEEEAKKESPRYLNQMKLDFSQRVCFVVGPEGGIAAEEREYLIKEGFISIALGKSILRTQTASLAMLAMLNYQLNESE